MHAETDTLVWLPWVLGAAFILTFALRDFFSLTNGIMDGGVIWGRDFVNLWTGGHVVRAGLIDILYDPDIYNAYQQRLFPGLGSHNYSYPPLSFPLVALFSLLPYPLALAAWLGSTGALFIWAARAVWPDKGGPVILALVTPAALVNIWAGHYGFLVGALFLLGWQRLDRQPLLAGLFFGLMLIKPHLAMLIPVVLLARRDWIAIASGAATIVVLIGLTTILYGWQPWSDYLLRTSGVQVGMIDSAGRFFGLLSTSSMTAALQLGASLNIAMAVQASMSVVAVTIIVLAVRRRVETSRLALLVATATFVVLPYGFNYDLTVVAIGALALWTRPDLSPIEHRLTLLGFMSPQLGFILAILGVPAMPLLLVALLLVQFRVACRDAGLTAPRAAPAGAGGAR